MSGKKSRKSTILKIIGGVILLLAAAVLSIPLLIDVNQFKPEIEARLSEAIGRNVSVGSMRLSLLSGSITADEIAISDDPAFSTTPFITGKSLNVEIKIRPLLFSRKIQIDGIVFDQPEISLQRALSGKWNFSDLAGEKPAEKAPGAGIVIDRLSINNGQITIAGGGKRPSVYENVYVEIRDLSFDTSFPFSVSAALPGGGTLRLQGEAGPLNPADTRLTPMTADLEVQQFDLVGAGVVSSDAGLAGLLDFSGTVSSDGSHLQSLGQSTATNLRIVSGGTPAANPVSLDYHIEYDLAGRKGTVRDVSVGYGKAVARLNGNFEIQGEQIALNLRLQGADMPIDDLAELLPSFGVVLPKGSSLQGGVLNTDLTAEGPLEKLVAAGTASVSNTRLVGFDLSGRIAGVSKIAGLQPGKQTDIETFSFHTRWTQGGTRVEDLVLVAPDLGTLSGAGTISPEKSLDFTMQAVLKPDGGLSRLLTGGSLTIPFFVRGTASDPQFVPDLRKAAGGILESILGGREQQGEQSGQDKSPGDVLRGLFKR
ncbi:MAG TPA: AsmA family protein [Acidobacteriota bacterium]|nr:AsmA family protein [Acidobacteriota bacterium]